ncbi:phosphonate ABC transporter ATP-binding protein [Bacteroidia bacterium]|nr:phosphonate ABC transporter ATP-binding protein [Bacteroidia bacterium]GHT73509.1 phosphonate ABC transporter ATP-binding protein [Bacteroidia bacterium]
MQDTIIDVRNGFIYHGQNLVLSDISFGIERGEFVYLVGKVGSGKSSLIKTINAELRLLRGEAWVAGYKLHNIREQHVPYLRRKIGVVFQDFQLLSDRNVHDNFLFVLRATGHSDKAEIKKRITDVLEKVDLVHKSFKMPHQLSGGEQQRVVIARALLNDPDIILADEPTGNLDPETSEDIMRVLHEINGHGKTILMATHNYNLLRIFPHRTIKCERGHLAEVVDPITEIELSQID